MKKNQYMSAAIKAASGKTPVVEPVVSANIKAVKKPVGQPNTKKFQPETRIILHRAPRGQNPK